MFAVNHVPIAVLPVPVALLVRVPVGVFSIGIGVDRRAIVRMDSSPIGPGSVICPVGAVHSRTASGVYSGAVTSLNRRPVLVMSGSPVFTFVGFRVKSGGRNREED